MSRYALSITFKSNEHPFSTIYEAIREFADDEDARDWERGMAEGLGEDYAVTLLRDGEPLPHPRAPHAPGSMMRG